ncbi:MAG: WD40 repeat domain-containing protein [Nitrospirota bacterium]
MYPETTPNSRIDPAVLLIPQEQELRECSPRAHTPAATSRVTGNTFRGAVAVKGLSCLLILPALVACTGETGDSSPPALSFAADCQGTTANQFTQPPAFVPLAPSSFLPNDGSVQAPLPLLTGAYGYNSFIPGSVGFPAVGGIYVDPILKGTIRRLTDTVGFPNQEDIYGHHWANANGSLAFSRTSTFNIISTTTGAEVYTNQPLGLNHPLLGTVAPDIAWDAIDPNRYYFYQGANLTCRNLVEQRNVVKTFPAPLEPNGGSLNTQDRSGRYFTVRYGGSNKVWDSQTDRIYSGSVTPLNLNGWVAITPDGNYLVTAAGLNNEHYSYAIDHMNHSIGSTPVNFWTLCGDHGTLVSAANGKNYFITFDCNNFPGIYRVDITLDQNLNQPFKTEADQIAVNQLLLPLTFNSATTASTNDGHLSAVSKEGPNQNWVFFDSETFLKTFPDGYDDFNSDPATSNWQPYEQEIIAMNVVTLDVRRYAHHRSRGLSSSYYAQPRISCSWDGSIILWTSNYNISSPTGYADMYGMAFSN